MNSSISKAHGEPVAKQEKEEPKKEKPKAKAVAAKATKVVGLVAGGFIYNLKNEPWDIRDAVMNREKYRKEDKCVYYFYKSIPGAGELERFRRERDCDEFENDLD